MIAGRSFLGRGVAGQRVLAWDSEKWKGPALCRAFLGCAVHVDVTAEGDPFPGLPKRHKEKMPPPWKNRAARAARHACPAVLLEEFVVQVGSASAHPGRLVVLVPDVQPGYEQPALGCVCGSVAGGAGPIDNDVVVRVPPRGFPDCARTHNEPIVERPWYREVPNLCIQRTLVKRCGNRSITTRCKNGTSVVHFGVPELRYAVVPGGLDLTDDLIHPTKGGGSPLENQLVPKELVAVGSDRTRRRRPAHPLAQR